MNKLHKLRGYLSLDNAAKTISALLEGSFDVKDILQMGLEGYIKLSVNFVNATPVKQVTCIKTEDIEYQTILPKSEMLPKDLKFNVPKNADYPISKSLWVQTESKNYFHIMGVYDLAMIGAEKYEIKQLIHPEQNIKIPVFSGYYLEKNESLYRLQVIQKATSRLKTDEELAKDSHPAHLKLKKIRVAPRAVHADSLAEHEHEMVIKLDEITKLIELMRDNKPQIAQAEPKPLSSRKEQSYQKIILGLMISQNLDPNDRHTTSKVLARLEKAGVSINEKTLRNIIKEIRTLQIKS